MKLEILIGLFVLLIFTSACTQKQETPNIQDKKYCQASADCATATCCHPSDVINKKYAPDCSNTICTAVCQGPLDCNAGKIECINNKCTIVKTTN